MVSSAPPVIIYGVVPSPDQSGHCKVHGRNLAGLEPLIVDGNDPTKEIVRFSYASSHYEIDITDAVSLLEIPCKRPLLILRKGDKTQHWIHDSIGLDAFYGALIQ